MANTRKDILSDLIKCLLFILVAYFVIVIGSSIINSRTMGTHSYHADHHHYGPWQRAKVVEVFSNGNLSFRYPVHSCRSRTSGGLERVSQSEWLNLNAVVLQCRTDRGTVKFWGQDYIVR